MSKFKWIAISEALGHEFYTERKPEGHQRYCVDRVSDDGQIVWTRVVDDGNGISIYDRKNAKENSYTHLRLGYNSVQMLLNVLKMKDELSPEEIYEIVKKGG